MAVNRGLELADPEAYMKEIDSLKEHYEEMKGAMKVYSDYIATIAGAGITKTLEHLAETVGDLTKCIDETLVAIDDGKQKFSSLARELEEFENTRGFLS